MNIQVEETDYHGKPVLRIYNVDKDAEDIESLKPVVSFGLKKARAILAAIDFIRKFVEANTK